jgi:hypothetical protein
VGKSSDDTSSAGDRRRIADCQMGFITDSVDRVSRPARWTVVTTMPGCSKPSLQSAIQLVGSTATSLIAR